MKDLIMRKNRVEFMSAVKEVYGDSKTSITRQELKHLTSDKKIPWPTWLVNNKDLKVGRGEYDLSFLLGKENTTNTTLTETTIETTDFLDGFVPKRFPGYVPFGHFNDIKKIIESKLFYTVYITGLSGNGKTMMVEEACARTKREMIRVNITIETDEDDLIGGFRLVNGDTVWQDGPVVTAMKRGAVLLLDEVDLASNKIMTLQPVLEGKSVYLKKIGEIVKPVEGFNVIATANTKGQGSDDGRYVGTMIMNEAFLERFSVTFEQDFPNKVTEMNILKKHGLDDDKFCAILVDWATQIRKSFVDGVVNEIISTRRLCHIVDAYKIFNDKKKALQLCLNRFDTETKTGFLDVFEKISAISFKDLDENKLDEKIPF